MQTDITMNRVRTAFLFLSALIIFSLCLQYKTIQLTINYSQLQYSETHIGNAHDTDIKAEKKATTVQDLGPLVKKGSPVEKVLGSPLAGVRVLDSSQKGVTGPGSLKEGETVAGSPVEPVAVPGAAVQCQALVRQVKIQLMLAKLSNISCPLLQVREDEDEEKKFNM